MTAAKTSARNYAFFKAYVKKEAESKCYSCDKWTLYGKTCKAGDCDK